MLLNIKLKQDHDLTAIRKYCRVHLKVAGFGCFNRNTRKLVQRIRETEKMLGREHRHLPQAGACQGK